MKCSTNVLQVGLSNQYSNLVKMSGVELLLTFDSTDADMAGLTRG